MQFIPQLSLFQRGLSGSANCLCHTHNAASSSEGHAGSPHTEKPQRSCTHSDNSIEGLWAVCVCGNWKALSAFTCHSIYEHSQVGNSGRMKLLRSIWINHHHFKNEEAIRVSVEFNILEKEKKKKEVKYHPDLQLLFRTEVASVNWIWIKGNKMKTKWVKDIHMSLFMDAVFPRCRAFVSCSVALRLYCCCSVAGSCPDWGCQEEECDNNRTLLKC